MKLSHKPVRYCLTEYRPKEGCAFPTALTHCFLSCLQRGVLFIFPIRPQRKNVKNSLSFAFGIMLPLFETLFDSVEFWLFCSKYCLTCVILSPACEGEDGWHRQKLGQEPCNGNTLYWFYNKKDIRLAHKGTSRSGEYWILKSAFIFQFKLRPRPRDIWMWFMNFLLNLSFQLKYVGALKIPESLLAKSSGFGFTTEVSLRL